MDHINVVFIAKLGIASITFENVRGHLRQSLNFYQMRPYKDIATRGSLSTTTNNTMTRQRALLSRETMAENNALPAYKYDESKLRSLEFYLQTTAI
jgi:hypothetical protein